MWLCWGYMGLGCRVYGVGFWVARGLVFDCWQIAVLGLRFLGLETYVAFCMCVLVCARASCVCALAKSYVWHDSSYTWFVFMHGMARTGSRALVQAHLVQNLMPVAGPIWHVENLSLILQVQFYKLCPADFFCRNRSNGNSWLASNPLQAKCGSLGLQKWGLMTSIELRNPKKRENLAKSWLKNKSISEISR